MALTTEQQNAIDFTDANDAGRRAHEIATDANRRAHEIATDANRRAQETAIQAKQIKLEAIRLAKETLLENARNKPTDSRDVTAADITSFAVALVAAVNT